MLTCGFTGPLKSFSQKPGTPFLPDTTSNYFPGCVTLSQWKSSLWEGHLGMEEPAMKIHTKRPSKYSRKHSTLINANTAKCCGIHLLSQLLRRLRQEEHLHHLRWHKVILCWKKNKDFIEFHTSRSKEQVVDTQWYCPFLPQTLHWQVHGGSYLVCVTAPSFVNRNITALCTLKAAMRHFINNSYIGWQSCSSLEISEMMWSGFKIQFSTSACFFHLVPSLLHAKEPSKGNEGGKRHTLLRLCKPQHMPSTKQARQELIPVNSILF